jgi:myosin-6
MSTRRYFKLQSIEAEYGGKGWWYAEFEGNWATRQVEVYPERSFISSKAPDILCDQSLEATGLLESPEAEISQEEFEQVWGQYA